jgi:hypothetical protein
MRNGYALLIFLAVLLTVHTFSWNAGSVVGEILGYNQAILDGKVLVECKFPCKNGCERESNAVTN